MQDSFRDINKESLNNASVRLAGIPFDGNASLGKGAAYAPTYLRMLSQNIPGVTKDGKLLNNISVFDYGDITLKSKETVVDYFNRVTKVVLHLFKKTGLTIFIGGDHSVNIPLFKAFLAFAKAEGKIPVLIHIDAHPDMMEEYLDNPYSHATPARHALKNGLQEENLVFVGLRGFETEEVGYFTRHPKIKIYLASDVQKEGINKVTKAICEKYSDEKYAIYVSYDIDVNDPAFAPGTGTPEAFGLQSNETLTLLLSLTALKNTYALDLVEISPPLDTNDITSWLALKTLYEIFYVVGER